MQCIIPAACRLQEQPRCGKLSCHVSVLQCPGSPEAAWGTVLLLPEHSWIPARHSQTQQPMQGQHSWPACTARDRKVPRSLAATSTLLLAAAWSLGLSWVLGHTALPKSALFPKWWKHKLVPASPCRCKQLSWWAGLLRNKRPSNFPAENSKECYLSTFHYKGHKILDGTASSQEWRRHLQLTYPLWHSHEKNNLDANWVLVYVLVYSTGSRALLILCSDQFIISWISIFF